MTFTDISLWYHLLEQGEVLPHVLHAGFNSNSIRGSQKKLYQRAGQVFKCDVHTTTSHLGSRYALTFVGNQCNLRRCAGALGKSMLRSPLFQHSTTLPGVIRYRPTGLLAQGTLAHFAAAVAGPLRARLRAQVSAAGPDPRVTSGYPWTRSNAAQAAGGWASGGVVNDIGSR